ncbi:hypothetical protein A5789_30405 [Nocardia sp. 852002-51101_SCH5132738]|nr:hypothetical protein A5789_30405 [Nocardia sp. 852002-51101_SCH5132738]OBF68802.1 hypothetical protein A9X06_04675 [Mycobacterium sp. 852002-51759_SCH5129042]
MRTGIGWYVNDLTGAFLKYSEQRGYWVHEIIVEHPGKPGACPGQLLMDSVDREGDPDDLAGIIHKGDTVGFEGIPAHEVRQALREMSPTAG